MEQLKEENKRLLEIIEEKDRFISILAHDLNNPVQGLMGITELIIEDIDSLSRNELVSLIKRLHNCSTNIVKLLKNLLEWGYLHQGLVNINPVKISLYIAVLLNKELMSKKIESKGIKLVIDIPEDIYVTADKEMFNSIISNLLSNSIKFTDIGGTVTIKAVEKENNIVQISVADNGIGMPEELSKKLFKIDEKVGRMGLVSEESTGLGLILCKEMIEKHGCKIWVESQENIGSTFYFTLPKSI